MAEPLEAAGRRAKTAERELRARPALGARAEALALPSTRRHRSAAPCENAFAPNPRRSSIHARLQRETLASPEAPDRSEVARSRLMVIRDGPRVRRSELDAGGAEDGRRNRHGS